MVKIRIRRWTLLAAAAVRLLAAAPEGRAAGPAAPAVPLGTAAACASTAPAVTGESYPFALEFSQGSRGSRVRLLYSLRWDGGELDGLTPGFLRRLINPFATARWIGKSLRRNQIYRVYGVRIRPNDLFIDGSDDAAPASPAAPSGPGGAAVPSSPHRRLSFSPFFADLQNDLRRDGFVESMDLALPKARGLDYETKRAMAQGLLMVDQQQDLSLFGLPARRGVEFFIGCSTAAALTPKKAYRLPDKRN